MIRHLYICNRERPLAKPWLVSGKDGDKLIQETEHLTGEEAAARVAELLGIPVSIDAIDDEIVKQRARWIHERPRPPIHATREEMLEGYRAEYRYHALTRERIERQIRALQSMLEDCDRAMDEAQRFAEEYLK